MTTTVQTINLIELVGAPAFRNDTLIGYVQCANQDECGNVVLTVNWSEYQLKSYVHNTKDISMPDRYVKV